MVAARSDCAIAQRARPHVRVYAASPERRGEVRRQRKPSGKALVFSLLPRVSPEWIANFRLDLVPMRSCSLLPTPAIATPDGVAYHPEADAEDVLAAALTWALVRDGVPFVPAEPALLALELLRRNIVS